MQIIDLLPPNAHKVVREQLSGYENLTIRLVSHRHRKLGDFRRLSEDRSEITLNADLPPYALLIVLIHETAHLEANRQYGRGIKPHGSEWKQIYSRLLKSYIYKNIFPKEISEPIFLHAQSPCATFPLSLQKLFFDK